MSLTTLKLVFLLLISISLSRRRGMRKKKGKKHKNLSTLRGNAWGWWKIHFIDKILYLFSLSLVPFSSFFCCGIDRIICFFSHSSHSTIPTSPLFALLSCAHCVYCVVSMMRLMLDDRELWIRISIKIEVARSAQTRTVIRWENKNLQIIQRELLSFVWLVNDFQTILRCSVVVGVCNVSSLNIHRQIPLDREIVVVVSRRQEEVRNGFQTNFATNLQFSCFHTLECYNVAESRARFFAFAEMRHISLSESHENCL